MEKRRTWRLLTAVMLSAAVWPNCTQAAIDPATVQKVLADDGAAGDSLGYSVAVDGNTAVIGAYGDDSNRGAAYVFVRAADGTWSQQGKLTAEDGAVDDKFGWSVSLSGSTAIIGAYKDDDHGSESGSAYVFVRSENGTWNQQAKLTADDGSAVDRFGWGVSVSGDTAVIGACLDADNGISSGSAYVFARDTDGIWTLQAKLTGADTTAYDQFSISVSVNGDTVVIGAPGDNTDSGSAYVFVRSEDGIWSQQAKLTAADGSSPRDWFGWSVSLSGDTVVIGEYRDDDNGTDSGSAYVFVRDADGTWSQQAKLIAADTAAYDEFGVSVFVSGDTAIIGSCWDDDKGADSGSAYVFIRDAAGTWSQEQKLTASDGTTNNEFGRSVSVSGDTAIIGAYGTDSLQGSAYVFSGSPRPSGGSLSPVYKLLLLK